MRITNKSLFILGALSIIGYVYAEQPRPAIHIKHKLDNVSARAMLKLTWKQCVQEKEMLQKAKNSNNGVWPIMKESLKRDRPDYDVDASLYTPSSWKSYSNEFEQEYFFNDKYAIYKERPSYTLSKDGRCHIISKLEKTATLDDGQFRYLVNINKGTAVKFQSGIVTYRENSKILRSQEYESALIAAADKLAGSGKKPPPMVQTVGSERVVGNYSCDYKALYSGGQSKICYWDHMNYYPSVLDRPIILKSVTMIGNEENIKHAEIFEIKKIIDASTFMPAPNIKIDDRTK